MNGSRVDVPATAEQSPALDALWAAALEVQQGAAEAVAIIEAAIAGLSPDAAKLLAARRLLLAAQGRIERTAQVVASEAEECGVQVNDRAEVEFLLRISGGRP